MNRSYRPALIVGGYGALAGVMAAMTYILMEHVQHLLWQNPYAQGPLSPLPSSWAAGCCSACSIA